MHSSKSFCVNLVYQKRTLCLILTWHLYHPDAISQCLGSSIAVYWKKAWALQHLFAASSQQRRNTRSASMRHGKQLADIRNRRFLEIERRSALGLIWVYNRLPEEIVRHDNVKDFQRSLQTLLKDILLSGCDDLKHSLSLRIAVYKHPLRWDTYIYIYIYIYSWSFVVIV